MTKNKGMICFTKDGIDYCACGNQLKTEYEQREKICEECRQGETMTKEKKTHKFSIGYFILWSILFNVFGFFGYIIYHYVMKGIYEGGR